MDNPTGSLEELCSYGTTTIQCRYAIGYSNGTIIPVRSLFNFKYVNNHSIALIIFVGNILLEPMTFLLAPVFFASLAEARASAIDGPARWTVIPTMGTGRCMCVVIKYVA